jgi:hypothetical protein
MKIKLLIILLFWSTANYAQTEGSGEVSIVTQGQGVSRQESIQIALRSAIEQAFGVFISSRTELLNDHLVNDEIITISNGNIKQYEVLNDLQINEQQHSVTVKSIVSVNNLKTFCASKGIEAEIQGGLFAMNIKQKLLNERAEIVAIYNLCDVSMSLLTNSLNFTSVRFDDPVMIDQENGLFNLGITVYAESNDNIKSYSSNLVNSLKSISIPREELNSYISTGVKYYTIQFDEDKSELYFRNKASILALKMLALRSSKSVIDFELVSNVDTLMVQPIARKGLGDGTYTKGKFDAMLFYPYYPFGSYPADIFQFSIPASISGIDCSFSVFPQYTTPEVVDYVNSSQMFIADVLGKGSWVLEIEINEQNNEYNVFDESSESEKQTRIVVNEPLMKFWKAEPLWSTSANFDNPDEFESIFPFRWFYADSGGIIIRENTDIGIEFKIHHILTLSQLEKLEGYKVQKATNPNF